MNSIATLIFQTERPLDDSAVAMDLIRRLDIRLVSLSLEILSDATYELNLAYTDFDLRASRVLIRRLETAPGVFNLKASLPDLEV